jgi:hypothetical protein
MTDELPPLPPCDIEYTVTDSTMRVMDCYAHSDDQMQDYARAAIAAHEAKQTAEPVAAQHRFRHPQKTMPDWSPWQPCKVADRPAYALDSQGYQVEYRALYTHPQPAKREPLTPEQIRKWWGSENGLEDCVMTKIDDFTQVVRAVEAHHGITKDTL